MSDNTLLEARREGNARYSLRTSAAAFAEGAQFVLTRLATTTPTPSPEAEALPTLPVVAWRRFSGFTGWHFWGDEQAEPGSPDAQDLTPHAPAEAAIVALRAEVAKLRKERDELNDARNAAIERANFMHSATREAQEFAIAAQEDTRRLDWMGEKQASIEEWMANGGEVGWRVTIIDHRRGCFGRHEIAWGKTPRSAIDAARASLLGDGGTL